MLFIVIPVHNRCVLTRGCLESLSRQTFSGFETVVVDDGSTDGTAEMVARDFPRVNLLRGDGSYFWTRAMNTGVAHALQKGATAILSLNDDVVVPPQFIDRMMYWHEKVPAALIGALEKDVESGQVVHGGETMSWATAKLTPIYQQIPPDQRNGLHAVTHLYGRGLLVPAVVFERIGLFDQERFPHYVADTEFTVRARRASFPLYCNYDASLLTFPEESGQRELTRSKSIAHFYQYLFGIKGSGNLFNYTRLVLRHCPPSLWGLALLSGFARRIGSYLFKRHDTPQLGS